MAQTIQGKDTNGNNVTVKVAADGSLLAQLADSTGAPIGSTNGLPMSMSEALSQSIDSILTYPRGSNYAAISANTLIQTGAGKLTGIFVGAASATPTIKIWDNTSGATTVLIETFTPVAGEFYPFPHVRYTVGLYITISGTVAATVFYDPTNT